MYLTKEDFKSHLYAEILNKIIRNDDAVFNHALKAGIGEAKGYMNLFDLDKIFGTEDAAPVYINEFIKSLIKDVVCWHLVKLSNPNVNLELFRTAYEDAIKTLEKVQRGKVDFNFPPKIDTTDNNYDESNIVGWNSNIKRNNHY